MRAERRDAAGNGVAKRRGTLTVHTGRDGKDKGTSPLFMLGMLGFYGMVFVAGVLAAAAVLVAQRCAWLTVQSLANAASPLHAAATLLQ